MIRRDAFGWVLVRWFLLVYFFVFFPGWLLMGGVGVAVAGEVSPADASGKEAVVTAEAWANLLVNSDWKEVDSAGGILGWKVNEPSRTRVLMQEDRRVLELSHETGSSPVVVEGRILLKKGWTVLAVSGWMKADDLQPKGKESWQGGRLQLHFNNSEGKQVGGWPAMPQMRAAQRWTPFLLLVDIPKEAYEFVVTPELMLASGCVSFSDLSVSAFGDRVSAVQATTAKAGLIRFDGVGKEMRGGMPVGWTSVNQAGLAVVKEGGKDVLELTNRNGGVEAGGTYRVLLDPQWVQVSIRAKVRIEELVPGTVHYRQFRLQSAYLGADGKRLESGPARLLNKVGEWVDVTPEGMGIVDGAVVLEIGAVLSGASGRVLIEEMEVVGRSMVECEDAVVPKEEKVCWGLEPVEETSKGRWTICLNGLWQFLPGIKDASEQPTEKGWGWIRVPGDWDTSAGNTGRPGLVAKGTSASWMAFNRGTVNRGWYQRTITIPAGWQGRSVVLQMGRVSTDAQVFLDGVACGWVNWPTGEVDLTKAVRFGQEQVLRVMVVATADSQLTARLMETVERQVTIVASKLESRGITGDVVIFSRPVGAWISDVFLRPSTRKKEIAIQTEIKNMQGAGAGQMTVRMVDEQGRVEKTFSAQVQLEAKAVQTITVTFPWENPRLWDVDQPNLYTAKVHFVVDGASEHRGAEGADVGAGGAGWEDEYAQAFGFREFWIEGKNFFLNNMPIRLRPMLRDCGYTAEEYAGFYKTMRGMGFNLIEFWPSDIMQRGRYLGVESGYDEADRAGMLVTGIAPGVFQHFYKVEGGQTWIWNQPGAKEKFEGYCEADFRAFRNHPSIVMWGSTGNVFGGFQDQNPRHFGIPGTIENQPRSVQLHTAGREAAAIMKKVDPSRPVFFHMATDVADMDTSNHYLNFVPLQEREDMFSHWAEHGQKPFMSVEFGTPLFTDFHRGRLPYENTAHSEPLLTEWAAAYFGSRAYEQESAGYRREVVKRFQKNMEWETFQHSREMRTSANFQEVQQLFITNTWRAWRTWGNTAGMVPWEFYGNAWQGKAETKDKRVSIGFVPGRRGPYVPEVVASRLYWGMEQVAEVLPAGKAMAKVNRETLAWIAGPKENFTQKTHHFQPGQGVVKSAVLLNDSRGVLPYEVRWSVRLNQQTMIEGRSQGSIEPAGTVFVPIAFSMPASGSSLAAVDRVPGEIVLEAKIGAVSHADTFAFRLIHPPTQWSAKLAIFDPHGKTRAMLEAMGCDLIDWDGRSVDRPVVIGRAALSDAPGAHPAAKTLAEIEGLLKQGGRVLVMAQQPDWLREAVDFRVSHFVSRRVFPIPGAKVAGTLDGVDLSDWSGAGTLVEGYPDYVHRPFKATPAREPYAFYRWGNQGSVASAAIEKPHLTGWRPLLECEFDLAWTALMEMDYGRGRITWSCLDLEDQFSVDVAAKRMVSQLLEHVTNAPLMPRAKKVMYLGDAQGKAVLDGLGLQYTVASADWQKEADLLIVGADAAVTFTQLRQMIDRGANVFVLPVRPGNALGLSVEAKADFDGWSQVPYWPQTLGLSVSDLHRRGPGAAVVFAGEQPPGIEVGANGLLARFIDHQESCCGQAYNKPAPKGIVLFCQLDPGALKADTQSYNRYTRWRQTRAMANMLANLGGTFAMDGRLFQPVEGGAIRLTGEWKVKPTFLWPRPESFQQRIKDTGPTDAAKAVIGLEVNDQDWMNVSIPSEIQTYGADWQDKQGEVVLRRWIDIDPSWAGRELTLSLGVIRSMDTTYFNGQAIGTTDSKTPLFYLHRRVYKIPGEQVKAGRALISVRVYNDWSNGGMAGQPEDLWIRPTDMKVPSLYHGDYRIDFDYGDDPFRYYRW